MKITIFQALTLLAQKYRHEDKATYEKIKSIYLSGVRSDEDLRKLEELLKDEALKDYEISDDRKDINEDPSRRYFESRLCHDTLAASLDKLDMRQLNRNFESMFNRLPAGQRANILSTVYSGTREGGKNLKGTAKEYAEGIRVLKDPDSYPSLKPEQGQGKKSPEQILQERKEKMSLLGKCSHAAMAVVNNNNQSMPLNLYGKKGYVYDAENRGRIARTDEAGHENEVRPFTLGIMRAYMPVPQDDVLMAKEQAEYQRPVDMTTYMNDGRKHQIPDEIFATKVTPFVNSISGTMLIQLRMTAQLLREHKYVYEAKGNNKEEIERQLKEYFKSFVAYMIYNAGGHSLNEFLMVLQLPEVQEEFKDLPGFSSLTLENLFKNENEEAFEQAMDRAIVYNQAILQRKAVHEELVEPKLDRELQMGEDELTVRARSRLKSTKDAEPRESSLDKRNKEIDIAYNTYHSTEEKDEKDKAAKVLIEKLHLSGPPINELQLNEKMARRQEEYRQSLFTRGKGTLAQRLDKAWECYQDENRTMEDRLTAQNYLIFVLDIKEQQIEKDLNTTLVKLMSERELLKGSNPEYIPGKAPIVLSEESKAKLKRTPKPGLSEDEEVALAIKDKKLLDVNTRSKNKDLGHETGRKTEFFDAEQRDMFRVLVRDGKFVTPEGEKFDTSDTVSHDKTGFAAFTLNVHGELSVFQHIDHDKTGIAHSSMNAGVPVFCAGEIQIKDGKLISLTEHSGHYRPSLYSIYKTLEYFRNQGVDISEAKVYSFADPSKALKIDVHKSKDYPHFYELKAKDLCNSYTAHMTKAVNDVKSDLAAYQSISFKRVLHYVKDFFTRSTLTSDRQKIAAELAGDLTQLSEDLSKANTVKKLRELNDKLETIYEKARTANTDLSKKHGKAIDNGQLAEKINTFRSRLNDITGRVTEAEKKAGEGLSDEDVLSSSEELKGFGRKSI